MTGRLNDYMNELRSKCKNKQTTNWTILIKNEIENEQCACRNVGIDGQMDW